jgi:hypothetical protein
MEKVFFSKENFNIIYNILYDKIQKQLGFDINTNQKFHKDLINIIKAVYQQRNTFNLPSNISNIDASRYLSQKSINVAINYFTETIKKINTPTNLDQLERDMSSVHKQNVNQLDNRPQSTTTQQMEHTHTNGTSNIMSNFNRLRSERDTPQNNMPQTVNFKEPNTVSNNDIQNKYNALNQNRQNDYDNIANTSSSSNTSQNNTNSQNGLNHPSINSSLPNQPNSMLTQQSYMNSPSGNDVQDLLKQQQELQNKINNLQKQSNISQVNQNINQPNTTQFNQPNTTQFNPPTQKNIQYLSEDNKPLNNILENQFTSLVDESEDDAIHPSLEINNIPNDTSDMSPDNNIDYNQILNEMSNVTDMSSQFNNNVQNINQLNSQSVSDIYPTKLIDNSSSMKDTSTLSNNAIPDHELQVIKSSIELQTNNINNTSNKIDSVIKLMEANDISKFYNTIMDIPKLITEQKEKPLTLRTHNLIVSSKDRDLSNTEFDKYKFRIVFGAEGTETQTTQVIDRDDNNAPASGIKEQTFTSTGMRNPTVQQVLKNVVSIKLKRVIIPKPRDEFYVPEPYFFLSVDEFGSNIISTKTFTDKIFCKIHFDKEFGFSNGRKYLYYKNDDDDFTMFYSSPLAKLDRLTLKLLDSDGDNAKSSFNDSDISLVSDYSSPNSTITKEFYANTFVRDRIYNITESKKTKVKSTNHDDNSTPDSGDDTYTIETELASEKDTHLVNLSNQLEYVFEIKTQEYDPNSELRPTL